MLSLLFIARQHYPVHNIPVVFIVPNKEIWLCERKPKWIATSYQINESASLILFTNEPLVKQWPIFFLHSQDYTNIIYRLKTNLFCFFFSVVVLLLSIFKFSIFCSFYYFAIFITFLFLLLVCYFYYHFYFLYYFCFFFTVNIIEFKLI